MTTSRPSRRAAFALVLGLVACTGGGVEPAAVPAATGDSSGASDAAPPPRAQSVAITVSPDATTLQPAAQQAFGATVTGTADASVTWSVVEGAAGGSVTATGRYTAPGAAGVYHVVVASIADPTKTATATITVTAAAPPPTVTVAVSPTAATLMTGSSRTFTCTVAGSTDTACTWSVQEGGAGGTVTAAGAYTAPSTAGTYHVVARSRADPTRSASAAVTVTAPPPPPPPVALTLTPASASVDACQTFTFSASVTGASNTAVTWSVAEGATGGAVSASGVYTAPARGGTYHVVAASQADPTKTRTAAVTVTERILSVTVAPSSPSVPAGGSVQLSATVTTTCGAFTQAVLAGG